MKSMCSRKRSERGAALVESGIVAAVVFFVIFSIVWGALLLRSMATVSHAAEVGVRAGSIAASDPDADFYILEAIRPALSALGKNSLQRVIVFRASASEDSPPQSCLDGTTTANCNIYGPADFLRTSAEFGPGGWLGDDYFAPSSRAANTSTAAYIGIYIEAQPGVNGLGLPAPDSVSSHHVLALESRQY